MKKIIIVSIFFLAVMGFKSSAQESKPSEQYGKTLNLGLGIGYYGYIGHSVPVFHLNYEFNISNNFTLAPFITFYTYKYGYYWKDNNVNYPYRNYYYHETVIPIGLKGTYYFDDLLQANSKWDFYLAGSLGFAIINSSWDDDYYGDQNVYHGARSVYFDLHVGTEYHFNNHLGGFLDLSTGVSTIGLAIH
ncbi:MAG TPA: hypothetical protein VFU29_23050 [Chitinophagaceae bacterium]|nr:hypothetical protein [Chitinophagaceae bacterium]